MNTRFGVGVELGHLIPPGAAINAQIFPTLSYSVKRLTAQGQQIWQAYAAGQPLPNGHVIRARSGRYLRSIQTREQGDFSGEVFSDLSYAKDIETGVPARDLKRMLNTSMKVRLSKKGKRYLIIPFRHGVPNNSAGAQTATGLNKMPDAVYQLWQGLKPSHIKSIGWRASGTGAYDVRTKKPFMVRSRQYKWGSRLTEKQLVDAGASGRALKQMKGMVHMQMRRGLGQKGTHGQYLTFRVMSEDSPGWIVKAREGAYPAKITADRLKPLAEKVFAEAMKRDVQRYLQG
ncbi:MAG TPA: hypothetical protein ENJ08_12205 [Gammaproteobacteria bacterium]|nr:hypothetical protein [Gammaproteobacteria bacterium]